MIKLLPKIIQYKLFYAFKNFKYLPMNYTFIISTVCNSRCKTCNVWKQKHDELKIEEWEKILRNIGRSPFWVTISGGEPFIQPHLVDLCKKICEICKPAILNIPTNSSMFKVIPKKLEEILKNAGNTQIIINLSLDGIGEKHDKIRGFPGNFDHFEKNYKQLKKLQKKYNNLTIGIHSVISKFNYKDTKELYDYALSLKPDQYITEIAEERKELDTHGLPITPSYKEYKLSINDLISGIKKTKFKGVAKITESFRVEYYQMVKKWLKERKQIIPCYAGVASCQISSWGEVWPCCIRGDNLGNLREHKYNFKKVWFGEKANQVRLSIKNKECECPLANAGYTNMLMHVPTLIKVGLKVLK